jgi:hypothetical protein
LTDPHDKLRLLTTKGERASEADDETTRALDALTDLGLVLVRQHIELWRRVSALERNDGSGDELARPPRQGDLEGWPLSGRPTTRERRKR